MKRLATPILATTLLLLTVTPVFSQVSLAVTGGVNIATLKVDTDFGAPPGAEKSVKRLSIGLAANIAASERGIQLGPDGTAFEFSGDCDEDTGLETPTFDLGLAGGGGLEITLQDNLGMSFGLLYTYGLLDLDSSDSGSVKQRALTLRAGLVYSIG